MIPLTIRHLSDLGTAARCAADGGLVSASGWDALRASDLAAQDFGLPVETERWLALCRDEAWQKSKAEIVGRALAGTACAVRSLGVGRGIFEHWLLETHPGLRLVLSDFSPVTVGRLARHLQGRAEVHLEDFSDPAIKFGSDSVLLMNRIDTELDDAAWKAFFHRAREESVPGIAFIPCQMLGLRQLMAEAKRRVLRYVFGRRSILDCGWARTRPRLISLFAADWEIQAAIPVPHGVLWMLSPRHPEPTQRTSEAKGAGIHAQLRHASPDPNA